MYIQEIPPFRGGGVSGTSTDPPRSTPGDTVTSSDMDSSNIYATTNATTIDQDAEQQYRDELIRAAGGDPSWSKTIDWESMLANQDGGNDSTIRVSAPSSRPASIIPFAYLQHADSGGSAGSGGSSAADQADPWLMASQQPDALFDELPTPPLGDAGGGGGDGDGYGYGAAGNEHESSLFLAALQGSIGDGGDDGFASFGQRVAGSILHDPGAAAAV
ncbi:hypothetical protein BDZ88DRAFT_420598 [Geranomyces variabilis]|nr:hypothetical protein BDZ88DRAFT_420598 [Geranomyces variabilis]